MNRNTYAPKERYADILHLLHVTIRQQYIAAKRSLARKNALGKDPLRAKDGLPCTVFAALLFLLWLSSHTFLDRNHNTSNHVHGFSRDLKKLQGQGISKAYMARLQETFRDASRGSKTGLVFSAYTQFGMSNRLRAIASAIAYCDEHGYWLRIIWVKDKHVNACLDEVVNIRASNLLDVWCEYNEKELGLVDYVVYNHMDTNRPREKFREIVPSDRHIFVQSGFRLKKREGVNLFPDQVENNILRSIVPNTEVKSLIESIKLPKEFVGVHIRQTDPERELGNIQADYSERSLSQLKSSFLEQNSVERFVGHLRTLVSQGKRVFYVAADDPGIYARLRENVANATILFLPRDCTDRSSRCLKFALADLEILGKSKMVLGSFWSSYSEVAGRLTGKPPKLAGVDF